MEKSIISVLTKKEVEINKEFEITVVAQKSIGNLGKCTVLFNKQGESPSIEKQMNREEEGEKVRYWAKVNFPNIGNYYFFFILQVNGKEVAIKISRKTNKPFLLEKEEESPYWKVLVTQENLGVPKWATDKIVYQIFVDRFNKVVGGVARKIEGRNYRNWGEMPDWTRNSQGEFHNNDFFGGNIKGITEKIEYFKKLSVGILYLSPINESLYRYERYASTNHMEIDPDAGTFEDLKELHEKANANGIKIIIDVAFNHCNSDNPIFQDAIKNPNSKYRNWFFIDNNGNYQYWYNEFKDMPVFNQRNYEFQQYVYGENGIIAKYAPYVDGFRLDLAEALEPFFLEGIKRRANESEARLIVGEYWNLASLNVLGKGIDSPTNYLFTDGILRFIVYGNSKNLNNQIQTILENYPQKTIDTMLNSLDTHDMMRALTILSGKYIRPEPDRIWEIDKNPSQWHIKVHGREKFLTEEFRKFEFDNDKLTDEEYKLAVKRLKIAVILQYFLVGNPCIFYGTEVGLHGFKDPFNRKCYPYGNEDLELLEFYQKIGEFRNKYVGTNSQYKTLDYDKDIFAFERKNETNSVFVVVNRGEYPRNFEIPKEFEENLSESVKFELNVNIEERCLLAYGGIIILK